MSLKNKIDFGAFGLSPSGATPNERQIEWFNRERMIFFHFGMNTFTDKEWGDGTESPSTFNPTELDVRQWVKAIKDGGFIAFEIGYDQAESLRAIADKNSLSCQIIKDYSGNDRVAVFRK